MPEESETKSKLSIGLWLAIIGTMLALVTAGGGVLSRIYASKAEVMETKAELNALISRSSDATETRLQNWRIQTVEVKVENMTAKQQQTSDNMIRLMERFNVEPVPEPAMKPLPPVPSLTAPALGGDKPE